MILTCETRSRGKQGSETQGSVKSRSHGFPTGHLNGLPARAKTRGQPCPFNLRDETWYTIKWHDIETTDDLLAVRAIQIKQMRMDRRKATKNNIESRIRAAKDYATKNARRLVSGIYRDGEFVLVALKGPGIVKGSGLAKSDNTWAGPFRISKRFRSGSYQLKELDGTILKGSVPAGHLKTFYTRKNQVKGALLLSGDESSEGDGQFTTETDDAQLHESDYQEEDDQKYRL